MKRKSLALLALAPAFILASCGGQQTSSSEVPTSVVPPTTQTTVTPTSTSVTPSTSETTSTTVIPPEPTHVIPEMGETTHILDLGVNLSPTEQVLAVANTLNLLTNGSICGAHAIQKRENMSLDGSEYDSYTYDCHTRAYSNDVAIIDFEDIEKFREFDAEQTSISYGSYTYFGDRDYLYNIDRYMGAYSDMSLNLEENSDDDIILKTGFVDELFDVITACTYSIDNKGNGVGYFFSKETTSENEFNTCELIVLFDGDPINGSPWLYLIKKRDYSSVNQLGEQAEKPIVVKDSEFTIEAEYGEREAYEEKDKLIESTRKPMYYYGNGMHVLRTEATLNEEKTAYENIGEFSSVATLSVNRFFTQESDTLFVNSSDEFMLQEGFAHELDCNFTVHYCVEDSETHVVTLMEEDVTDIIDVEFEGDIPDGLLVVPNEGKVTVYAEKNVYMYLYMSFTFDFDLDSETHDPVVVAKGVLEPIAVF